MIVLRTEHADRPNEVAVYLTPDQWDDLNTSFLAAGGSAFAELGEREQRRYCRAILDVTTSAERPKRLIVELDDNTRLDSSNLGHELVERFSTEQNPDDFDPDYRPVDFTFRVLGEEGARMIAEITPASDFDTARMVRALDAARLAIHFSFTPPSLA